MEGQAMLPTNRSQMVMAARGVSRDPSPHWAT